MLLLESLTNAHRCWQQETGRYLKLKLEDRLLQAHARSQVRRALINSVCLCVSLTVCVSVRVCTCSLPGPTSPHQPPLFLSHAHTILRRERECVCRIFLHCICTRSVCMSLCVCVCVCVFVCHVCVSLYVMCVCVIFLLLKNTDGETGTRVPGCGHQIRGGLPPRPCTLTHTLPAKPTHIPTPHAQVGGSQAGCTGLCVRRSCVARGVQLRSPHLTPQPPSLHPTLPLNKP